MGEERDMTKTVNIRLGNSENSRWRYLRGGRGSVELLVSSTSGKGNSPDFSGSWVGGGAGWVLKDLLEPLSSFSEFLLR